MPIINVKNPKSVKTDENQAQIFGTNILVLTETAYENLSSINKSLYDFYFVMLS